MQFVEPPGGRPWGLIGLCSASVLLNVVLGARLWMSGPDTAIDPQPVAEAAMVAEPAAEVPALSEAPVAEAPPEGVQVVRADVSHSLARTFQSAVPEHGDVVSAVYARLFFWDLDLRADLQKGDRVELAYTWDGQLAHIPVAKFASKKLGKTLSAYRFKATNDTYDSWWDDAGQEMAFRLKDSPLTDYEQITSLLKDRPKHRGMDFKVPEGTAVVSPRSGSVVRVNWNVANNGNCVEIRYADGVSAKFLHLVRTDVKEGERVQPGQTLGLSGNTGHSTAPHLHYELERGGAVLDPIDYHGVVRRMLPESDQASFSAERQRLEAWLQHGAG
jgi:murein DD-endopeptidase